MARVRHYPADREAAEKVMAIMPPGTVRTAAAQNRGFIGRSDHDPVVLAHGLAAFQYRARTMITQTSEAFMITNGFTYYST
jgi:hypothetical protein